jgi:hypothetical protein
MDIIEEPVLVKSEIGIKEIKPEPARPPDFTGDDHNIAVWVNKRNVDGEPVLMSIKIGELRFRVRKRFL